MLVCEEINSLSRNSTTVIRAGLQILTKMDLITIGAPYGRVHPKLILHLPYYVDL